MLQYMLEYASLHIQARSHSYFIDFFLSYRQGIPSSSEHLLLKSLHQTLDKGNICLTSMFLMCVFAFEGLVLMNSATCLIAPWPCGLRVNTHTRTHARMHARSTPCHAGCYHKCPDLEGQTETDSTKISLQGSHVNTSRCNFNSISHGKSPSGMAVRGSASKSCSDSALRIVRDQRTSAFSSMPVIKIKIEYFLEIHS